jgi:hypothetical protein
MSRKILRCMLIVGLLLFGVLAFGFTTYCADTTRIYIDPPSIEDPNLDPGETFSVNVTIANVSNLLGYDFNMSYNTAILTCTGVSVGPLGNMPSPMWLVDDIIGNVWINVTYGTPLTTISPATLASITFLIHGRGSSVFDLYSTSLVDILGEPISHEVSDGYFVNGSPYDLNKDGHIDILDIRIVAKAFGSAAVDDPETPWDETLNWNPIADVNADGRVDIFDLRLVAKHYGEI